MSRNVVAHLIAFVLFIGGIVLSVFVTRKIIYDRCVKLFASSEVHDTTYIRDTFTTYVPTCVKYTVLDSVLVPVTDTLSIHDTLYATLPYEQVEWRDSLCAVYASGIYPKVDSVTHFQTDMIVTITKPFVVRKHWGFSIGVGPAVIYTPFRSPHIDAGVGIFGGLTYTF